MRQTDDRSAAGAAAAVVGGAAVVDAALTQLRGAIDTLASVEVATLGEDCLTRAVRDLAAIDGRVDGVQARFVRAAEAAEVPKRSGATSTTDWLSETTGRSKRQAARTDRMARTMDQTPQLAERLATGQVGPGQADRIARGLDRGTLDPADAADLLEHATHLQPGPFDRETKRLEGRRHQRRLREQEQAAHNARNGSTWRSDDGSLGLSFLVPPADGDLVDKALHAFVQPDPAEVPVRAVVNAQGQVLDVGRATRKWPSAIRTAITVLDGGDRTPGSDLPPHRCEIHHIAWWENGGGTSVHNGILLGKRGHAMIHREGWTIDMDPATRICTWTSPDGATTLTTHPRGTAARGPGAPHDIPQLHQPLTPANSTTRPAGRNDQSRPTPAPPWRDAPARGDPPGSTGDPPQTLPLDLDL